VCHGSGVPPLSFWRPSWLSVMNKVPYASSAGLCGDISFQMLRVNAREHTAELYARVSSSMAASPCALTRNEPELLFTSLPASPVAPCEFRSFPVGVRWDLPAPVGISWRRNESHLSIWGVLSGAFHVFISCFPYCWVLGLLRMVWALVLYQMWLLQDALSGRGFSFHSLNSVLPPFPIELFLQGPCFSVFPWLYFFWQHIYGSPAPWRPLLLVEGPVCPGSIGRGGGHTKSRAAPQNVSGSSIPCVLICS
jgi:hypothetical protein